MAENFNCSSCSVGANFFCVCVAKKVYLCEQCISAHCKKGGAHAIAPISAQKAVFKSQDIDDYNRKRQVIQELTSLLDDMSAKLSAEQTQLTANVNQMYSEEINRLYFAYQKAGEELAAWYQGISDAFQRMKEEIMKCEQEQRSKWTADTLRFVQIAAHIREISSPYINLAEELNSRISLSIQEPVPNQNSDLTRLFDSWRLQPCNCQHCLLYQQALGTQVTSKPRESAVDSLQLIGCPHYPNNKRLKEYPCCWKLFPCDMCHDEGSGHKHKTPSIAICKVCGANQSCKNTSCKQCTISFKESK